ncbi:putative xylanase/chitin deacetylase [Mycolicibacterium chubuense NBB4]|uniref:Putative xylanase/chitin deacetylase n=1 Tax=Mycolicibacterium chubuense (strain NBB4) TaxID=710421 RepID=I4BNK4_MYCCN|nr:polysaccharide deacetylase family protein [Mycolicibacterium chubuense]AFM18861.1 putative xylanase/chitin deacetylase [Mycolicibacterium chubuense NBB4]
MTVKRQAAHRKPSRLVAMARTGVLILPFLAVVAAYLGVPAVWQWAHAETLSNRAHPVIVDQIDTPPQPVDPNLVASLRRAPTSPQSSPLILTYHDIGYNSATRYTVTPEAFAAQMRLLHDAGWTTITADQLSGWLRGEPLPAHSVMVSFDDGARGVWRYADPVLERYGQHAVAYLITGFVGTHAPYYMTWPEIAALHASGRWDLEAHTHLGHQHVPTDAVGGEGPFLTHLEYLADQKRVETQQEYHSRVFTDLVECRRQFSAHDLPEPTLFAYPFSAHNDDPNGTGMLKGVVGSLYQAAMLDVPDKISTTASSDVQDGNIARMDVMSDLGLAKWTEKLVEASPLDPTAAKPIADPTNWTDSGDRPAPLTLDGDGRAVLDPGPRAQITRQYAPYRTSMWNAYTVSADLGGFSSAGDGTTTGLSVLTGDPQHEVDIEISSAEYSIRRGYGQEEAVAAGHLVEAAAHHVEAVVRPENVTVTIDGGSPQVVPLNSAGPRQIGGGIGLIGDREFDASPTPVVSGLAVY